MALRAMPDVSIVIPTLDAEVHVRRCLAAIDRQQDVELETVVVDQSSADGTAAVAKDAGATVVTLPRPTFYSPPAAARNAGAAHASGTYLLHLDADMELTPGLLAACMDVCSKHGHVALVIHEVDVAHGYWASCKALERRCYVGVRELEGARFVRSDIFGAVGGYDENLGSGEDWDVHRRYERVGTVGEAPIPLLHHLGRVSLAAQARKKFSYGRTAARFLGKHRGAPIASAMWRSYWDSKRTLAHDPVHALGMVALRACEALALVAGMAAGARTGRPRGGGAASARSDGSFEWPDAS